MEFPKRPTPIAVVNYLQQYVVNQLKFNPSYFTNLFSLAIGVNQSNQDKYGCIFLNFPDASKSESFGLGYQIFMEDIDKIPSAHRSLYQIQDHIVIKIGPHLYAPTISEIVVIYYLLNNQYDISGNLNEQYLKDKKDDIQQYAKQLIETGHKISLMIQEKQQQYKVNSDKNTKSDISN